MIKSKSVEVYCEDKVSYMGDLSNHCKTLLCDAQTSGGLLIAMNSEHAKEFVKEINEISFGYASIIGEVIPKAKKDIIVH